MRFTWTGVLLAPLPVPILVSAALAALISGNHPVFGFLIFLVPGCVISYGTMIFLFLPSLFVLAACRPLSGLRVCLLGVGLSAVVFLLTTLLEWKSSGADSGPPTESFLVFLWRWTADPFTAIYPLAGLITAGLYWHLGGTRNRQPRPAAAQR